MFLRGSRYTSEPLCYTQGSTCQGLLWKVQARISPLLSRLYEHTRTCLRFSVSRIRGTKPGYEIVAISHALYRKAARNAQFWDYNQFYTSLISNKLEALEDNVHLWR